jgi:hypothetical protein
VCHPVVLRLFGALNFAVALWLHLLDDADHVRDLLFNYLRETQGMKHENRQSASALDRIDVQSADENANRSWPIIGWQAVFDDLIWLSWRSWLTCVTFVIMAGACGPTRMNIFGKPCE